MRAKTLLELMSLSTNLYMIAKDEKFLDKISEMAEKGKEKFDDLVEGFEGEDERSLSDKIMQKAVQAKAELEEKIAEIVVKLYDKMNIAHVEQIKDLQLQIDYLKREIANYEARIATIETKK